MRNAFALAAVAVCLWSTSANAGIITSNSTDAGFNGFSPNPIPIATFNFTPAQVTSITTADSITITFTLGDGDSGAGDFDFNALTLYLDGIDTGVLLNGYPDGATVTLTTGPFTPLNAAAIFAALQDGTLVATIVDATPNDNAFTFTGQPATLSLEGIDAVTPEPMSLALFGGLALAGVVGYRRRQG